MRQVNIRDLISAMKPERSSRVEAKLAHAVDMWVDEDMGHGGRGMCVKW